jgi:hypothetical protein
MPSAKVEFLWREIMLVEPNTEVREFARAMVQMGYAAKDEVRHLVAWATQARLLHRMIQFAWMFQSQAESA